MKIFAINAVLRNDNQAELQPDWARNIKKLVTIHNIHIIGIRSWKMRNNVEESLSR